MNATEELVKYVLKRYATQTSLKSSWSTHWDDLCRVMLPRRMGFATTQVDGARRTEDIYDGTPMQAARGLANAVAGLMRPQGLPELEMKVDEDEINDMEEAQAWLTDSVKRLKAAFNNPKARFRQASGEKDLDLVVLGTAILFIGESANRSNLLFQTVHLKDGTPMFNDEGAPEGLFRKRTLPLRNVIAKYGAKNLSVSAQEKAKNDVDQKIDILLAVLPRENARPGSMLARNLPFADYCIEIDTKHLITEGGYHEFPFAVPRWDTTSGEDYGRSPGMIALPDADTLQAMGETILIAGQRAADPPLAVPNDGTFDSLNTFPGGLAYYDIETAVQMRGNPFFPMESGTNLPITRDMQHDTREQIWSAFFRNILNLPTDGPQMTATEIIARKEEIMREIGPTFGRMETDDTAVTCERAFMVMLRGGGFAPIPDILQGQNIRFEYDSPVARIRKQIEAKAASMWVSEQIAIAKETGSQEVLDLINFDENARFSAEALGIPKQIINSEEVVEGIRQSRQEVLEQQQKVQAAEMAITAAGEGANIAETTAKTQQIQQQSEAA